jgi:hypothetical protein
VAASHIVALQSYRRKFGQSWQQCGILKKEAKIRPPLGPSPTDMMARWASMVIQKLHAFCHHQRSQTLKERKAIANTERPQARGRAVREHARAV